MKDDKEGKKINKSHFNYDSKKDEFICPAGHTLKLKFIDKERAYRSDNKVCAGCDRQKRCVTKRESKPTIYIDNRELF